MQIGTPPPTYPQASVSPSFGSGEGVHTRLRERGVGGSQFRRGKRHCWDDAVVRLPLSWFWTAVLQITRNRWLFHYTARDHQFNDNLVILYCLCTLWAQRVKTHLIPCRKHQTPRRRITVTSFLSEISKDQKFRKIMYVQCIRSYTTVWNQKQIK